MLGKLSKFKSSVSDEEHNQEDAAENSSKSDQGAIHVNILEQANDIVNKRSEEKKRTYGPFSEGDRKSVV